jgi:hypothetical protein
MASAAAIISEEAGAGIIEAVVPAVSGPAVVVAGIASIDVAIIAATGIRAAPIAVAGTAAERQRARQREQRGDATQSPASRDIGYHPLVSVRQVWTGEKHRPTGLNPC